MSTEPEVGGEVIPVIFQPPDAVAKRHMAQAIAKVDGRSTDEAIDRRRARAALSALTERSSVDARWTFDDDGDLIWVDSDGTALDSILVRIEGEWVLSPEQRRDLAHAVWFRQWAQEGN